MITVRRATLADVPWLLGMLRQLATLYGTRRSLFPDDATVAVSLLAVIIKTQPFFVAERNGAPIGCVAGYLIGHPFNPDYRVLAETFWIVEPSRLSGFAAAALLDAFVAHGREQCVDAVTFGAIEGVTNAHARHFERRGFRLHERFYLLEVA